VPATIRDNAEGPVHAVACVKQVRAAYLQRPLQNLCWPLALQTDKAAIVIHVIPHTRGRTGYISATYSAGPRGQAGGNVHRSQRTARRVFEGSKVQGLQNASENRNTYRCYTSCSDHTGKEIYTHTSAKP
jgi:hypothetical protein